MEHDVTARGRCVQHAVIMRHRRVTIMGGLRVDYILWHDDVMTCHDTLSTLLALCEGNPPIIGGFPTQRAGNA